MPQPGLGGRDLAAERAARRAARGAAGTLIPSAPASGVPTVPINQLMPSPVNGRKKLLKITELADLLRVDGMNTAMTVVPPELYIERYPQHREEIEEGVANGAKYVVHHGHRRLAAALEAGLEEVPVLIRTNVPSMRIAAIQENLQRMALNPVEEGEEFVDALNEEDDGTTLTQRELATRVGCSQAYVSTRVALATRLIPELQAAVEDHWLKEQGLEPRGQLLLPVREAATIFCRLREDLQHSFATGQLTAMQAAALSQLKPAEQSLEAIQQDHQVKAKKPKGSVRTVPEPRTQLAADRGPDEKQGHPSSSAQPIVDAPGGTTTQLRVIRVVGGMEQLALDLIDALTDEELKDLKGHLHP